MADIAASVLTRLKNKAQASGRSYQLCLQLFCQEEFLRRLEKSKYAENFVLKGGLFIYSLTEFDSRVTVDVDFLLRQMPNTPEQLRVVLEEIIAAPTENGFVTFEIDFLYRLVTVINVQMRSDTVNIFSLELAAVVIDRAFTYHCAYRSLHKLYLQSHKLARPRFCYSCQE